MKLDEMTSGRNLLVLAGCVALFQVACYYLAGMTVRGDGAMAIAQPDTLLYCQAARRIAEGAPFSYSVGTAASTGTTSVIYPFILAVPYALGLKGDLLITAGFVLNAAFYLIFLLGWCSLACRISGERPAGRVLSIALLATFGPFAYCALAQSDIGLWMAVSAWLAYGLYCDRKRIYVPLLLLAPWVRPEGMIVAVAFGAFCAIDSLRRRRVGADMFVVAAAALSVVGVFVLNYALTGECQFSSVAHKGHFKNLSFTSAAYASAIDLMRIVKAYLLGLPQNAPRDFYFLPLIGAACMWIGVFARKWREASWRELAWYLAMAGGIATVATSGWQNTNLDRYLIWIMPVPILYMAYGANKLAVAIWRLVAPGRKTDGSDSLDMPTINCQLPTLLLVAFNVIMSVTFVWIFRHSAAGADAARNFAARCEEVMPEGASVGTWGDSGIAYSFSNRRLAHLSGIYSMEFVGSSSAAKVGILKNEPETRFDYWFCKASDRDLLYCGKPDVMAGEVVLAGPPGLELRKPDWSVYDAAVAPPKPTSQPTTLRARIDVAYDRDEKACAYEALTKDDYPLFAPFVSVGKLTPSNVKCKMENVKCGSGALENYQLPTNQLPTNYIVECGRFLLGGDAMTVPLEPGKDVHVTMRTALKCSASVWRELGHARSDFALKSPMRLKVLVDGAEAGDVEFAVSEGDFCDAQFTIPGKAIATASPRLTFLGEHVAFCYWFFQ